MIGAWRQVRRRLYSVVGFSPASISSILTRSYDTRRAAAGATGVSLCLTHVYRIDPRRMIAIEDARPLQMQIYMSQNPNKKHISETYVVMISSKSQIARSEPATPRTAEETMCVIGDVTLMESRLAMLIRKPMMPCSSATGGQRTRTRRRKGRCAP